LLFEQVLLNNCEELFGFSEGQAQLLDALRVLLQSGDVRYGFLRAIIGAHDKLQFDTHGGAPPVGVVHGR